MSRHWIKQHLPDARWLRLQLSRLGVCDSDADQLWSRWLSNPALWQLNRRSVSGGVAVGLLVSWLPIPLQMLAAAFLASVVRVHVPVSVVMVWFTNPLTVLPQLYLAWRAGSMLTGITAPPITATVPLGDAIAIMMPLWPAVLAGCLFWGVITSVLGYAVTQMCWRWVTLRRWRRRQHLRRASAM